MDYKDQFLWNRSVEVVVICDRAIDEFNFEPGNFTLASEIKRLSTRIPVLLAEDWNETGDPNQNLLTIDSVLKLIRSLETHLILAKRLKLGEIKVIDNALKQVNQLRETSLATKEAFSMSSSKIAGK
ncbi:MAG: four helix bundle protein [Prochloraceae cyanobacterium]|nr:four helix bundle protein [Prochloraceae cyanobacterium]